MADLKECSRCLETLSSEFFSKDKRAKSGLQSRCKSCDKVVKKEKADYYREWHLQNKYNISSSDYDDMLIEQKGKCAICAIEEKHCENQRLAVDHDHGTGEVRALLCKKCNQAIGLLQDSSEFAKSASDYLVRLGK